MKHIEKRWALKVTSPTGNISFLYNSDNKSCVEDNKYHLDKYGDYPNMYNVKPSKHEVVECELREI